MKATASYPRRKVDPIYVVTKHMEALEPEQRRKILLALNIDKDIIAFKTENDFEQGDHGNAQQRYNHYLMHRQAACERLKDYLRGKKHDIFLSKEQQGILRSSSANHANACADVSPKKSQSRLLESEDATRKEKVLQARQTEKE